MSFLDAYEYNAEGEPINPRPTAIHFKRLANYNQDWSLERIIFFEYMITLRRGFGNGFFKQLKFMTEETKLSSHKLRIEKKYFQNKGFLKIESGTYSKHIFYLNEDWIYDNIDQIFNLTKVENNRENIDRRRLIEYYKYQFGTKPKYGVGESHEILI